MANRARLGGSPLGLIGLKSSPDVNGNSTFNGGNSRNVNVSNYNKSRAGSLFTGKRVLRAWPDIQKRPGKIKNDKGEEVETEPTYDTKGLGDVTYPILNDPNAKGKDGKKKSVAAKAGIDEYKPRPNLHTNSVYDTSILNIIEQLAPTKASLKPADFDYLKNVGVYPNNRLMIARRFAAPSGDNIMLAKGKDEITSLATLITWQPEGVDFLDFTFGEEWTDAEADFKGILNSLGEDVGLGNLGGIGGAAGNVLPLPGFTEIFQRNFLGKLGLLEEGAAGTIPAGNPNLIKQAKQRKTIGYSTAGSGLKCTVNIKMTCEYELKYISGIDPTIVWMDLLGMIVRFGTSSSETYGLSSDAAAKLIGWANNPDRLVKDVVRSIKDAIKGVAEEVTAKILEIYGDATLAASKIEPTPLPTDPPKEDPPPDERKLAEKLAEDTKALSMKAVDGLTNAGLKITSGLIQKYRVKIIGIVNALSGLPSTPWHITIGNPMRPMFCSGDMLVESVQLKLGSQLAFNDLPSSITVEFSLSNARPWGLQEIMAKFNSGYLRTVDVQKSFYETKTLPNTGDSQTEPLGLLPLELSQEGIYKSATPSNTGTGGTPPTTTTNTNTGGSAGTSGTGGSRVPAA